ncbi:MAG: hypothetical protein WA140_06870, partial [Geobacteraceae bacterium]
MVSEGFPGKGLSCNEAGHWSGYLKNEGCVKEGNSAWKRRAEISAATSGAAASDNISRCHGKAPLLKSGAYLTRRTYAMPTRTIGFIAAIPEEIASFLLLAAPLARERADGFTIYRGAISGQGICLILSGIGRRNAA